jgi:nucleoside-diphosphate-sugar epimerase
MNSLGGQMNKLLKKEEKFPLCFVSAAEAGWPEVRFGTTVDGLAPEWLNQYLVAKRAVEKRLKESGERGMIREVVFRPSLIWDWTKLDVLPVIPVFNLAAAVGVPFVDKTVRVETLADAIVAGLEGEDIQGVQKVGEMERICERVR